MREVAGTIDRAVASEAPLGEAEIAELMAPLEPFGAAPVLAVAVSGGPDSLALAVMAARWAHVRGGRVLGLVADHGLRPDSTAEAAHTQARLARIGVASHLLTLDLTGGPALAERARRARYAALEGACAARGIVHLLLGHHASDQAETVAMRAAAGSGPDGLAGMAAVTETNTVRLLRPLLGVAKARLRATVRAAGLEWVEDPSNHDPAALRGRMRLAGGDEEGLSPATAEATEAAVRAGLARAAREQARAAVLAERVRFSPLGFAVVTPGPIDPGALAAVLRAVAGREYAPASAQVAEAAGRLAPGTLGGVRISPAGRLGPGWLLTREAAAMQPAVPAATGAVWDGRFRLHRMPADTAGLMLGAVGWEIPRRRSSAPWPAAVLQALPALWARQPGGDETLAVVPHLEYPDRLTAAEFGICLSPRLPAAGGAFLPGRPQPAADRPAARQPAGVRTPH